MVKIPPMRFFKICLFQNKRNAYAIQLLKICLDTDFIGKSVTRYDSILDLIGVSQKKNTDSVLLLDDYINAVYIPDIFLDYSKA